MFIYKVCVFLIDEKTNAEYTSLINAANTLERLKVKTIAKRLKKNLEKQLEIKKFITF
jgi:ribosomal protein L33